MFARTVMGSNQEIQNHPSTATKFLEHAQESTPVRVAIWILECDG
jgi:hypothetical protein